MSDITFECGHCNGSLTVEARGAGLEVPCPLCGQSVRIPKPKVVVEIPPPTPQKRKLIHQSQPSYPETKRCPYCAETIQFTAKKCKHCGEIIDPAMRQSTEARPIAAWSVGEMVILMFLTVMMPVVGIGFGIYGMTKKNRKVQGVALLLVAIVVASLAAIYFQI